MFISDLKNNKSQRINRNIICLMMSNFILLVIGLINFYSIQHLTFLDNIPTINITYTISNNQGSVL